jgi:hypothetical protein
MWYAAIVLFALAAVGGVVMALKIRAGELPPKALALGHGALAATGLVLLLIAVLDTGAGGLAAVALVLFVGAALGGFVMFAGHLKERVPTVGLVAAHALAAVAAFVLLLVYVLGG